MLDSLILDLDLVLSLNHPLSLSLSLGLGLNLAFLLSLEPASYSQQTILSCASDRQAVNTCVLAQRELDF